MVKAVEDESTSGDPMALGDAAQEALAQIGDEHGAEGFQGELEGMDYTKVKFVGVQFDALETPIKIGDELVFLVKGKVVGVGDEAMNDGHVRHFGKVKVSSVTLYDVDGE